MANSETETEKLAALISEWREPGALVRVPPAFVVPDSTNREHTQLSVEHIHYIASLMEKGFKSRRPGSTEGHDIPVRPCLEPFLPSARDLESSTLDWSLGTESIATDASTARTFHAHCRQRHRQQCVSRRPSRRCSSADTRGAPWPSRPSQRGRSAPRTMRGSPSPTQISSRAARRGRAPCHSASL